MKIEKKDKGGNLMENSTELVIAVLILVILFAACVKIYTNFLQDREINSAKRFGDVIEQRINDVEDNNPVKKTINSVNGEGWFLTSFNFSNFNRPDACFEQLCLAICKGNGENKEASCKEKGVFKKLDFDEIIINVTHATKDMAFARPTSDFESWTGYYNKQNLDYLAFEKNKLLELEITKKMEGSKKILVITHYTNEYLDHMDEIRK